MLCPLLSHKYSLLGVGWRGFFPSDSPLPEQFSFRRAARRRAKRGSRFKNSGARSRIAFFPNAPSGTRKALTPSWVSFFFYLTKQPLPQKIGRRVLAFSPVRMRAFSPPSFLVGEVCPPHFSGELSSSPRRRELLEFSSQRNIALRR